MGRLQRRNIGNMNRVNDLSVGMTFKNYRALCDFLNAEILEGTSKQVQVNEWGRYFRWTRQGQKYIVVEKFTEPRDTPFMVEEQKFIYVGIDVDDYNRALDSLRRNNVKIRK